MKNSIALTLLVVVLAYNVNCDRVPPARPPVNNPGVIIPTRTTKGPTRQTMPIGSRTPPQRTTVRGNVPVTTRV